LRFVRVAVLASGTGSLLEAILEAGVPVSLVVVDRPCRAIEIAEEHGVPGACVERASFGTDFDRTAYTDTVVDTLQSHDIDLVVMAGFGTVFDKPIFDAYENRIINTHPALLPAFKGWHAVEAALAYGVKVTGCTVHVATLEVDSGPILAQEAVPVLAGDTAETLHERIKTVERRLYVDAINEIIERGSVLP
jgi:phosphoribosylglycinamide formyltransferase-1